MSQLSEMMVRALRLERDIPESLHTDFEVLRNAAFAFAATKDAATELDARELRGRMQVFACDPDESAGLAEEAAYPLEDPKHPNWHSRRADLYDLRDKTVPR